MKCPLCGTENAENAKYCTECGDVLTTEEVVDDVIELSTEEAPVVEAAPVVETTNADTATNNYDAKDVIFCSSCWGECKKGDLVCRHCGAKIDLNAAPTPSVPVGANKFEQFMTKLQNEKIAKIVSIITIFLCAIGAVSSIGAGFSYIDY